MEQPQTARYQVTGNEFLSLPTIRECDGAIEGVTVLHMGSRGLLELRGDSSIPFLTPYCRELGTAPLSWTLLDYWIPRSSCSSADLTMETTYLCPLGEKAFSVSILVTNHSAGELPVTVGIQGTWCTTLHEVNETVPVCGTISQQGSEWNHSFAMQLQCGPPLIAFAPCNEDSISWTWENLRYHGERQIRLAPGESVQTSFYFGIGYEIVAAATAAKHLFRLGYARLLENTRTWLQAKVLTVDSRYTEYREVLNRNLFFCYFFSTGYTFDTEDFCMMTSRSSRYYVSAAFWDRDSFFWSFPAILLIDTRKAREMLLTLFSRHRRNIGIHSRYIDGTLLEPGFELDELCAPILALHRYLERTKDQAILHHPDVAAALEYFLETLACHRHSTVALYDTFLQPTDDWCDTPYLTYCNVLVWKSLMLLSDWLCRPDLYNEAQSVEQAIASYCVTEVDGRTVYLWATDLDGKQVIYDEPPGSLQLLPYWGFCSFDDPVWKNTASLIRASSYEYSFAGEPIAEIGCAHAPHPWILSLCNSLLCGHEQSALAHLALCRMDNGLACESVDSQTGLCTTGEAFATCAGFLSYALYMAIRPDR